MITTTATYYGPTCLCGSRRTRRIHGMRRECCDCHETYEYRVTSYGLVPLAIETAAALDEERAWKR